MVAPERQISPQTRFAESFARLRQNVEEVIQGKSEVIDLSLICLLAEGHLLIEDVPGVGKTMLAKAIAKSTASTWRRIQFTPDLLPSDITGVSIFDAESNAFVFKPGAVFANIVLGDEINRASPKTQSSLLEAMEERQVTVDGVSHVLDQPFMVMATQNPIEHEGTYPLPESQLDRFMMRIEIGYPSSEHAVAILDSHAVDEPLDSLEAVVSTNDLVSMMDTARNTYVAEPIKKYVVEIVEASRSNAGVYLGASPRAALLLLRASRARAAAEGREYVIPDDVKALAKPVLAHRLIPSPDSQFRGLTREGLVEDILKSVRAPSASSSV